MQDEGTAPACWSCTTDRAVWRHPTTGEQLCEPCGLYAAGRDEGEAGAAKEQPIDAVVALSGLGVAGREVLDLMRGELAGRPAPIGPEPENARGARVWATRLEAIDG